MNIQRHRRCNVTILPRNINTFDHEDRRIDQDVISREQGLDDFSPRGSARRRRSALRTAKTDEDKISESMIIILAGMLVDE